MLQRFFRITLFRNNFANHSDERANAISKQITCQMAKILPPPANDSNSPTDFSFTERKFLSSSSGLEPDIAVDRPGFHLNEKDIQDDLIEKFFQQYCKPPSIFASLKPRYRYPMKIILQYQLDL